MVFLKYVLNFDSGVPLQTNNAKQDSPWACGLRGRKFGKIAENVFQKMGIYFYAGKIKELLSIN